MITADDIEHLEEYYGHEVYFEMCNYWLRNDFEYLNDMSEDVPNDEVMRYVVAYWEWRGMQFDPGYVDPVVEWNRKWQQARV